MPAKGFRYPVETRFWSKVKKRRGADACWDWTAHRNRSGYGQFWVDKRGIMAHRWAYEALVGPIPEGLTIDHLCGNALCVNPFHMEPVTLAENIRRSIPARIRNRTHCPQGHPYSPENTWVSKRDGHRQCRTCNRLRMRAHYRENPEVREKARVKYAQKKLLQRTTAAAT